MALITWEEKMSVKVAEFDKHHQRLVLMINELHEAMVTRKTGDVLRKIVDELIKYTATHFAAEEKYFDQFNYPNALAHKKEHRDFVEKVIDVNRGLNENRVMLSMEIMNFLKDWLINHINGTDKKYSSFFNQKGLK